MSFEILAIELSSYMEQTFTNRNKNNYLHLFEEVEVFTDSNLLATRAQLQGWKNNTT